MAGIINIVLNKQKKSGLNALGTLTASYPQRHSATISFNNRHKKVNVFGSAGVNYRESPGLVNYNRETYLNDTTYYLDQHGDFIRGGLSYHAKIGMDYFFDDKTSVTLSSGISPSTRSNTRNTDYLGYNMAGSISDEYVRETIETESALSMDHAASFTKEFSHKKQVLKADVNYSKGEGDGTMDMTETYDIKYYSTYDNDQLVQRTIDLQEQENLTLQTDYSHPLGKAGIIELGLKSAMRRIDLDYDVEELNNVSNEWINLTRVSNHFKYDESIHAVYGLMGNQHGSFQYQVGIRVEKTLVNSILEDTGEKNEKDYIHAFPSVHLSNEFEGGNEIQLSYSKRIKRPSYRNLNPFNSYADPLNQWIGNPGLNPEFTHSMELSHIKYWKKSFISSGIYYRHTDSVMQRIKTLDSLGISTTRPENLSQSHSYGIELSFSQQLFKWWKINGSFNYFRRITDGGNLDETYKSDAYSWSGRANSQMTFWKDLQLQWMFNYRGPRETTQGTRSAMYFFDVGIKKEVLDQRGSVSVKVRDVFNSRIYDMETFGANFYIHSQYQRSPRMVFASFSYKINDYRSRKRRERDQGYEMDEMGM
jgi:outer membrane receptor protein involved in Fe transport